MSMQKKYGDSLPLKPLVVKLGGSLYERVPELMPVFQQSLRPLLIVPGGGRYADKVREAQVSDDNAHWMAILAMNQYGSYIMSFGLNTTDLLKIPKKTVVFLPFRCTKYYDPLPHTWDVTSDTIAAWVAGKLGLELLMLKSVDGIWINGKIASTITHSIETDVVDPCCIPYILNNGIRTTIINGSAPETVTRFLRGEAVSCTRIGTTF
jgi:5-(aminomethyl)-3-furanmethanol phosphate kinase